ncbi:hypothetical protein [Haloarcula litorea]|uniref:hypothetical protein n=1 Tax=Haloarcula litorea TaxID=3032579 RepID=UPI0023E76DC3|nr:hypothetical protein [Halomicroarcula sp. GDY20]
MAGLIAGVLGGSRRQQAQSLAMLAGIGGAVLLLLASGVLVVWTYRGRPTGRALVAVVVAAVAWTAFVLEAGAVVEYVFGSGEADG